jgi:hypothetical protein
MKASLLFSIVLFNLLLTPSLFAQTDSSNRVVNKSLQQKLLKIGREDQKYRIEMNALMGKLSGADGKKAAQRLQLIGEKQKDLDRRNLQQLEEIIKLHGWPAKSLVGKEACNAALLVIAHAELSYQKKNFPLIKAAAEKNEAHAVNVANLEDIILTGEGRKQKYGSRLHLNEATQKMELYPIEDEENVDARRASVGLPPMTEYLKLFGLEYTPPKKQE